MVNILSSMLLSSTSNLDLENLLDFINLAGDVPGGTVLDVVDHSRLLTDGGCELGLGHVGLEPSLRDSLRA